MTDLHAIDGGPAPEPQGDTYRLLTTADLAGLPQPRWLIDGLLPAGFNVLYGPSGAGKSFLALDWALCVASGAAWFGRDIDPAPVLYIAAEGAGGLHRRVSAWEQARHADAPMGLHFLPEAVNLMALDDVDRAKRTIAALPTPPGLLIVDTLARSMLGADENAARDVGLAIAAIDELRGTAAALVVHHTGKNGDDERGSSALRGAADSMIALRPGTGDAIGLACSKMKDAEPFATWRLRLQAVADSAVLVPSRGRRALDDTERDLLAAIAPHGPEGVTIGVAQAATGLSRSAAYRAKDTLVELGHVAKYDAPAGGSATYAITATGSDALLTIPGGPRAVPGTADQSQSQGSIGNPGTVGHPGPEGSQATLPVPAEEER